MVIKFRKRYPHRQRLRRHRGDGDRTGGEGESVGQGCRAVKTGSLEDFPGLVAGHGEYDTQTLESLESLDHPCLGDGKIGVEAASFRLWVARFENYGSVCFKFVWQWLVFGEVRV